MTEGWEDAARGTWRAPAPWWRRVWVVTPLLVVLGAGTAALSPDVRHQILLSTTRVDPEFVELSFVDESLARACLRTSQGSGFAFVVRSHLDAPARLPWTVEVTGGPTLRGDLDTRPGMDAAATVRYRPPRAAYTVRIALEGRPEHLVLHCGAGGAP